MGRDYYFIDASSLLDLYGDMEMFKVFSVYEIWDFYGSEDSDCCLSYCDTMTM